MSAFDIPEIGDTEARCLDMLAGVHDALVDDIIAAGTYSGPDAAHHAKNQAVAELHEALVDLVRARRRLPAEDYPESDPPHAQYRAKLR